MDRKEKRTRGSTNCNVLTGQNQSSNELTHTQISLDMGGQLARGVTNAKFEVTYSRPGSALSQE